MSDRNEVPKVPFKFAVAGKQPAKAEPVAQCKGCGCSDASAKTNGVKPPPVFHPQAAKTASHRSALPLQAKMAAGAAGSQVIQRAEIVPPDYSQLQALHAKWDRDWQRSQRKGKDDDDGDDGGDGGGGKKPGFTFPRGVTKGTCFSGSGCTGNVLGHPHHQHNCCGGRGSSGSSYRDYNGSCSDC
ncbi:hypothetical protein [Pseudoduganella violaceinigra]|uniref:hypothetical protein n=1 Tax=Pseudoduganella violaceinigra TaxID=246602 RepID=UPI0012B54A53|nr:hypothetical protein [Pseudoduganella violaceinigra]